MFSHCSHLDYFNNVFTNFSGLADECTYVPKMNESLTGLEQHQGEKLPQKLTLKYLVTSLSAQKANANEWFLDTSPDIPTNR